MAKLKWMKPEDADKAKEPKAPKAKTGASLMAERLSNLREKAASGREERQNRMYK